MIATYISLALGLCLGLFAWLFWVMFREVKVADRQYMDRPAIGFRLTMPLIDLFVHYFGGFFSQASVDAVSYTHLTLPTTPYV